MNLTEVAGIDFLSTPPTSPTESARAIPVSGTEPNNHPRQEISPEVAVIRIACNCGGHGWNGTPHHCAKLFQLEVEVKGLSSKPVVEIPKVKDFDGDYKSKPGRLQSTMRFKTAGGAEKEILLNLGVGTRMSNTANVLSPRALEKLRVGLQYCRVGAERYVPFEWVENKDGTGGTAIIKFKVRARRVRQLNNGWEFKDDAGSGIRGKPHEASAFRFWACLQHSDFSLQHSKPVDDIIVAAIQSQSGTYNFTDVRVWSKGNCPAKNRRLQGAEAATEVSVSISPNLQGVSSPPLPFLPVAIPMPIQLEQQQQHHTTTTTSSSSSSRNNQIMILSQNAVAPRDLCSLLVSTGATVTASVLNVAAAFRQFRRYTVLGRSKRVKCRPQNAGAATSFPAVMLFWWMNYAPSLTGIILMCQTPSPAMMMTVCLTRLTPSSAVLGRTMGRTAPAPPQPMQQPKPTQHGASWAWTQRNMAANLQPHLSESKPLFFLAYASACVQL